MGVFYPLGPRRAIMATKPKAVPVETTEAEEAAKANGAFTFVDDLPEEEYTFTRASPTDAFVLAALENVGKWAKLTTAKNRNGARTKMYTCKKRYPGIEWAVRGNDVYGRAPAEA